MSGSLADYVALGATACRIEDKLFYDFAYIETDSGGVVAVPASGVSDTSMTALLNPGLKFNAAWTGGPGQALDSMINYTVLVLPGGNPIGDISATMNGCGFEPNGIVGVAETTTVGGLLLSASTFGTIAFDRIVFAPPTGPISVHKDISVNGHSGVATVSGVINQYSEAPEPAALMLVAVGLLGLSTIGRRVRS